MYQWLAVALGGALGSSLRYLVGLGLATGASGAFPLGTWVVNVLGSFLLALLSSGLTSHWDVSATLRLLLTTGLCGGFTTYSTFNAEWTGLFLEGKPGVATLYIAVTGIGCGCAGLLGGWLARTYWNA